MTGRKRGAPPGQSVDGSNVNGPNVQVGGDVRGPIITAGVNIHLSGLTPIRRHDPYLKTRNAIENHHHDVLDRDEELQRLLDDLPHAPASYRVVEGPAFAGKTAFMVELHRRVRSLGWPSAAFYVVDRYTNEAEHFLEAVIGQLLVTLGVDEPLRPRGERDEQFDRVWDAFAALGTDDAPALLLLDGLDEQRSAEISRLLPVHLQGHVHVIVATRHLPDYRTTAHRYHPLSSAATLELDVSPHASGKAEDAKRELETWFCSSSSVREDIATALLVAGAPLSRHDLADLLNLSVGEVAAELCQIERCLLPLGSGYQWAHAKYSEFVDGWVRTRQTEMVRRMLAWADSYAQAGWKETTPSFLLHGLHHFLHKHRSTVGTGRLGDLVTNARRQRLLVTDGHDRTFVETIELAREELADSDAESRFRLAVHLFAVQRATRLRPPGVLRLLVLTGQEEQAEGIAVCVEATHRADALAEVAQALAEIGNTEDAQRIVDLAWRFAHVPKDEYWRLKALLACASAAQQAGARLPQIPIEDLLSDDRQEQRFFGVGAKLLATTGQPDAAIAAINRVVDLHEFRGKESLAWVLVDAAVAHLLLDDPDSSVAMMHKIFHSDVFDYIPCDGEVGWIASELVRRDRLPEAVQLADQIEKLKNDELRTEVGCALIEALCEKGEPHLAKTIFQRELEAARSIRHRQTKLASLALLRRTQAKCGSADISAIAELLIDISSLDQDRDTVRCMAVLGEALLVGGHAEEASSLARRALVTLSWCHNPFEDITMEHLVTAFIQQGDLSAAQALADRGRSGPTHLAIEIAEASAGRIRSLHDLAGRPPLHVARIAVALAPHDRTNAMKLATKVLSRRGDREGRQAALHAIEAIYLVDGAENCEALLDRITDAGQRAEALAKLANCCRATDRTTAERLTSKALKIARRRRGDRNRMSALGSVLHQTGPLTEADPGVQPTTEALAQILDRSRGAHRVELGALAATSLHHAGLHEQAKRFAMKAYEAYEDSDDDDDALGDLYAALSAVGEYDLLVGSGSEIYEYRAYIEMAKAAVRDADTDSATKLAQKAFDVVWATSWFNDDEFMTASWVQDMLDTGRVDLALRLFERFEYFEGEHLVHTLIQGMTTHGREDEALAMCSGFEIYSWRAAGLVACGLAPTWPAEMRLRNLHLLKDVVIGTFAAE